MERSDHVGVKILKIFPPEKGIVMKTKNKKKHLLRIIVSFIMILFAMCLAMNVLLYGNSRLYEFSDKTSIIETWEISESIDTSEESSNTICFKLSLLDKNDLHTEDLISVGYTRHTFPISMPAAFSNGFSPQLFLTIVFLLFFLTLFILLPDGCTLINQKVRLDN